MTETPFLILLNDKFRNWKAQPHTAVEFLSK